MKKNIRLLFRLMAVLAAGVMISAVFLADAGSNAWFSSSSISSMRVAAADIAPELTSDQEMLMDVVYPGLREYSESLKDYIAGLRSEINNKNVQLAELDKRLADLEAQYELLLEKKAILTEQINNIIAVQPPVTALPETTSPPAAGGEPGAVCRE